MAAMAPALTDAPAEAHRIRFKLAPPSSNLSPSGVESSGGTSHILVSSNGTVKRKAPEERGPHGGSITGKGREDSPRGNEAPSTPLGKLQPLVASYLCSDVTSVPSTKESLKLQGVLLQKHGLLPSFLPRKHKTLELSEEQLKSIMSNSRGGGPPALSSSPPPVNGVAKKLAKNGADRDRDSMTTVNGGNNRPPAGHGLDSPVHQPQPHTAASRGNSPLNGGGQHQQPTGLSYNPAGNTEQPAAPAASTNTPMDCPDSKPSERPPSLATDTSSLSPTDRQTSLGLGSLGVDVKERTQQSQSRQGEIEGRLRRLRKRLQVVQAKQVEHHVQQQLGGLLESTLGPLDALRPGGRRGGQDAPLTPQEREGLGRFLKDGSVPAELERLSLSGTTNLRSTESAFDSDATESSSGGETDVEEDELTRVDIEQRHISLWRRAEGRYAVDRASIVSHWNWLQAHVSDLEYRIRQQTDIYRQLRSNKGSIMLAETSLFDVSPEDRKVKAEPVGCPVMQECGSDGGAEGPGSVETSPRKGCASGRQVNGIINSLRPVSPEGSDPEEQLRKQQQNQPLPQLLCSPQDDTCVSARTRPLLSCKRRRLVRPSTVTNLNRKGQRLSVPGPRCGCEVNPQCLTCGGRTLSSSDVQYERPLLERLSQFDPCVHPILSLTDDVAMSLHLQRVLKSHWNSRPLEKIKPLKKSSLKHKLSVGRPHDPSASFTPKDKHKMTNSLLSTVRLSHHKVRSEKLHRQQLDSLLGSTKLEGRPHYRGERGHGPYDKSHTRKRPREHSLSLDRMDNTPKLYLDGGSLCPSLSAGLHTPAHSSLLRQLSASSETCSMPFTPFNSSLRDNSTPHQPIRRRRGESSFDINNIVIPMSVAATTRVEKLQYKEILTPSWKEVDICSKPIAEEADIEEVEDLTDTAFSQLHQSCEDQERSRWSWTASAIAKRRGSRSYVSGRSDGRTTPLLGCNNPSSPDTAHFHALPDYGSAASPCSPASPDLQSYPYAPGCYTAGGYSYTPIGSRDSYRLLSNEDTRCSTPDGTYEELVPIPVHPWDRRSFPLEKDPPPEPEEQPGNTEERPYRTMRHISGCKTGSSRSESDTGGSPSPLPPDDSSKQKAPSASTTLTRPSHR
uniref:KAT8 regulatory NSL complex subunit 1 isoform X1 n=1 Tax=Oncorhynchus gorbuscha TaxID=8017 RepID=UPI001EAF21C0|nr:KAT8 regulatory NSL complex subunit 1 isoform X1 [Oncorhynchus gorbuscha]XP_046161045.1 KAT8 regulatory NSL complex subunit 1 isoform X1 [Oncorhynchus gorbuscha]XP_046161046.1 KAT8 regulatory NSL complex subunit 1 isoform X1 [Oncorhynchus gorbuscha]